MIAQLRKLLGIGTLILAIIGCQPATATAPEVDNSAALTLTSLLLTLTVPPATPTPVVVNASATSPTEGFTTATEFSPTIEATAAPVIMTPTVTLAPTSSVPMVSVTTATNCRRGPGQEYEILGVAQVGIKFVLIGKYTLENYWIIRLQNGSECWLWGEYAIVEGDVAFLPEYAMPAPPIPQVGSITGSVQFTDSLGIIIKQPRPRIEVIVTTNTTVVSQMTNQDGNYTFDNLPIGEVLVSFTNTPTLSTNARFTVIVQAGQPTQVPTATVTVTIPNERHPTPCGISPLCGGSFPTPGPVQR